MVVSQSMVVKGGPHIDRRSRAQTQLIGNTNDSVEIKVPDTQNLLRNHYNKAREQEKNMGNHYGIWKIQISEFFFVGKVN